MNFNFAYLIAGKTPYKPIFRTSIVEPQIKVCWITAEISYVSAYQWVHLRVRLQMHVEVFPAAFCFL